MTKPLTDRLVDAADWVYHQDTPAPDWEALLLEAREALLDRDATIEALHKYCERADNLVNLVADLRRRVADNEKAP